MCWHKRDMRKAGITIVGMLLLLVLMVWVPVSAAGTYKGVAGLATQVTGMVQATPTEDTTVTSLNKEKLAQEVQQLKNQNAPDFLAWLRTNVSVLLSTLVVVGGGLIGLWRWLVARRDAQDKELKDRRDAQDKDLKDKAEERFKTAVTALGDDKEGVQVGGAILLRSFLNKGDKKNYERYYTQIFDLAVAYLRFPRASNTSEDPDGIPHSPENPTTPLPLTALSLALIVVFKEAFPLARDERKRNLSPFDPRSLDASRVQLDGAYLAHTDLSNAWMREASLREANLADANLCKADLRKATLTEAELAHAHLEGANLRKACLEGANLRRAHLEGADLSATNLRKAILSGANLSRVNFSPGGSRDPRNPAPTDLSGANPEDAQTLEGTDLREVIGLTKEQLEACKAKGAIIDEDIATSSPPPLSQSNGVQVSLSSPAQVNIPTPEIDGSSAASSQLSNGAQPQSAPPAQSIPPPDVVGSCTTASKSDPES